MKNKIHVCRKYVAFGKNFNDNHIIGILNMVSSIEATLINITVSILHFLSFRDTDLVQVVKILPCGRQGPVYGVYSIPWLVMTW